MVGRFPEKRDSSPNETSGMCNDFVETAGKLTPSHARGGMGEDEMDEKFTIFCIVTIAADTYNYKPPNGFMSKRTITGTPSVVSGRGYPLQTAHLELHRWHCFARKPANHLNCGGREGLRPTSGPPIAGVACA